MAGEVRRLVFSEGVTVNSPQSLSPSFSSFVVYSDDADFVLNEGAAQEGSVYYNSTTKKIRVYNGTSFINIHDVRGGVVNLVSGESSKTISFSSPWADSNYVPKISILCDDLNPIFLSYIIQNVTSNGFDVKLNAQVDSNNYKISYQIESAE